MPNYFSRIIAFLLVPCSIANPTLAVALPYRLPVSLSIPIPASFQEEAISPPLEAAQTPEPFSIPGRVGVISETPIPDRAPGIEQKIAPSQPNSALPPYRAIESTTARGRLATVHQYLVRDLQRSGFGERRSITVVDFGFGWEGNTDKSFPDPHTEVEVPETWALAILLGNTFPHASIRLILVDQESFNIRAAQAAFARYRADETFPANVTVEFVKNRGDMWKEGITNVDRILCANVLRHYTAQEQRVIRMELVRSLAQDGKLDVIDSKAITIDLAGSISSTIEYNAQGDVLDSASHVQGRNPTRKKRGSIDTSA